MAPAGASQEPVKRALGHRVLYLVFISGSQRTGFDHTARTSGKTEVGQQRFLFRRVEVSAMSSAASGLFENAPAVGQEAGL